MLRTEDGRRVWDVEDIPAILALAELATLVERKWVRHVALGEVPNSAAARHRRETGHTLRSGCCFYASDDPLEAA